MREELCSGKPRRFDSRGNRKQSGVFPWIDLSNGRDKQKCPHSILQKDGDGKREKMIPKCHITIGMVVFFPPGKPVLGFGFGFGYKTHLALGHLQNPTWFQNSILIF